MLQDVKDTVEDVVAVGEDSHLQGAVCPAGEDTVAGPGLHLHDAGADVAEDGLLGVLGAERMHEAVARQLPDLEGRKGGRVKSSQSCLYSTFIYRTQRAFQTKE